MGKRHPDPRQASVNTTDRIYRLCPRLSEMTLRKGEATVPWLASRQPGRVHCLGQRCGHEITARCTIDST